jgi:hypothetical protein
MIIIPIGVDCGNADFLKKNNIRNFALPFDWVVTYNGVSNIIKNDFHNFIPNNCENYNDIYSIAFPHNKFPDDNEKIVRRINRFKNILETTNEKIFFLRKGHGSHNHGEHNNNILKNEVTDAEDLDNILKEKYPNLNYEIIVILICGNCFNAEKIYTSSSKNIKIYNISMTIIDDKFFNDLCSTLFVTS